MKDTYYKHIVIEQPTAEKIQKALDAEKYFSLVDAIEIASGFYVVLVLSNE